VIRKPVGLPRAVGRVEHETRTNLRRCAGAGPAGSGAGLQLDRPRSSRRKKNTPTHIGYEDQAKIDNLNSDIRRLSSSTLGSASSRAREIRAAKSELRQIYRKYGIKPP